MGNQCNDPKEDLDSLIEDWKNFCQYFPFEIEESQIEADQAQTEVISNIEPLASLEELGTEDTLRNGDSEKRQCAQSMLSPMMKAFHPSVAAGVYLALHTGDIRLLCVILVFFLLLLSKLPKG